MATDLNKFLIEKPKQDLSRFSTKPQDNVVKVLNTDRKGNQTVISESKGFLYNPSGAPSLIETAKNIPSSAYQIGEGIFGALRHPVQTAKGLGSIAVGAVEKIIPGEQRHEASFDALTDFFKQRYGSVEAFSQTMEQDPVGFLSDVASVIYGGGAAVQAVSKAGKFSRVARVGATISKFGAAIEPITTIPKFFGRAVSKAFAPFTKMVDTEIQRIAGVRDVTLPIGAQTTSRTLQFQEVLASKGIFGRKVAQTFDNALDDIKRVGNDVIAKVGGEVNDVKAGTAIIDGLAKQKRKFIDMKNNLYDEVLLKGNKRVIAGQADDLATEARKFKSAEEFVEVQQNYLFHGTNEEVLESIVKDGLKPMGRDLLSLSKDEAFAKNFARQGITPQGKTNAVLLRVKEDLLKGKTVFNNKSRPKIDQLHEILTKETILPKALEVSIDNGKSWKNLITGEPTKTKQQLTNIFNQSKKVPLQQKTGALIIQAPETQKLLVSYTDELKRASAITGKRGNLPLYDSILKKLETGKTKVRDYHAALKQINQAIKEPTSFIATGDQARLMKLAATMGDELDAFFRVASEQGVINPSVVKALDEANEFYKSNIAQLNNRLTRRIMGVASQPEKVFDIAFKPTTGIDEVKQIMGVLSPEDIKNFRATALNKIMDNATSDKTGYFTTAGIQREMSKLGNSKMNIIFTPEQIKTLEDLDKLSKAMDRVGIIAGGSQTAFLQRSWAELIGSFMLAFQDIKIPIAIIAGDATLSKIMSSKLGRKWLLQGFEVPSRVQQGARVIPPLEFAAFQENRIK